MWTKLAFDVDSIFPSVENDLLYCFELKGWNLVMAQIAGEMHIFRDRCPHMGASFRGGHIENGKVVCPKHKYRFNPNEQDPRKSLGCLSLMEWRKRGDAWEIKLA